MANKLLYILGFWIIILVSLSYADSELYIYEIGDNQLICSPILDKQLNNIFVSLLNVSCVPDWQCSGYSYCGINDIRLCTNATDNNYCDINYFGNYSELAVSCNYCNENIQSVNSECYLDESGFQKYNQSYIDLNFGSCCAVTGLLSDCHILVPPYSETEIKLCSGQFNTTNTINCDTESSTEYGFGDDKIKWFCNFNQTPESNVTCISYVKDVDGGIVQTNPSYDMKLNTILPENVEDRSSFVAENGLVQVYFTKDNLVFDKRDYVYGVKCSDGNAITEYQKISVPEYENINEPVTILFWAKNNLTGLMLGGIILFAILLVLSIIYKIVKKG